MTRIGDGAFGGCIGLVSIEIPNSVNVIEAFAFHGCVNLTSIEIPNSVSEIGSLAFVNCAGLASFDIPNSVKIIGWGVFHGCTGLTTIEIPGSVTNIGTGPFSACKGLIDIIVECDNPNYVSRNGVLYDRHDAELIQFPCGRKGEYEVKPETEKIGAGAFEGSELSVVRLGRKIKTIERHAFNNAVLTELHIRHERPEELIIDKDAFSGLENCTLYVPIGTGYAYRHHPAFQGKFKEVVVEK